MRVDAWDAWTPAEVAARLDDDGGWAVAGGWAIDLFAGGQPRDHEDLELVTSREGLNLFQAAMPELEWYAAHDGDLTSITQAPGLLAETWQTWGWDQSAEAWRVDVMREPWSGERWAFRRNPAIGMALSSAIHTTGSSIPFLAPEIILLFKAKHLREKDQRDFQLALPLLTDRQSKWLAAALLVEHPDHVWLRELLR